jgi:hypothetical protein
MKRAIPLIIVALLALGAGVALAENPYNGNWKATWVGTAKQEAPGTKHHREANVVILDNGGSFQNLASARGGAKGNPCVGLKAPISVKKATAEELVFVIEFASVLHGCEDSKVTLQRVDDKTLKGMRDQDKEITLVRD